MTKKPPGSEYTFNKSCVPFPEPKEQKEKPPVNDSNSTDNSNLFAAKAELSIDEKIRQTMDTYRKAERVLVVNFYTGGGAYKRGVLDAIYRGNSPYGP